MHPAQNFAGCWVAGCTQLKILLGAGWLGAPSSKFSWVLGGWVHPAQNFTGCWVAGCTHPAPRSTLGTQLGGFSVKNFAQNFFSTRICPIIGQFLIINWSELRNSKKIIYFHQLWFLKIIFFTFLISHSETKLGAGWLGAPTQHPGPPWVPSWVDFSNTDRDLQVVGFPRSQHFHSYRNTAMSR